MAIPSNVRKQPAKSRKTYPPEIKEEAVKLFEAARPDFKTRKQTAEHVAGLLGVGCFETIMSWVIQSEIDGGRKPGMTTPEIEEMRKLRRENAELKRTNAILKAASAFFAAELDRPFAK